MLAVPDVQIMPDLPFVGLDFISPELPRFQRRNWFKRFLSAIAKPFKDDPAGRISDELHQEREGSL